ncbi:hypothetical protein RHS04_04189 [Rhizoctonia solani]|uniref:Uncharacterized protein n=1 Tax=Rhizoctonia solani TaxID=456999 RepID=A0A8H7LNN1_9AGAM|nr:hypothetical protein RHS04_04189 [Rhizoctonia solani]
MRSYPCSSHAPSPYSISKPRAMSIYVAQARSYRLTEQGQYWGDTTQPLETTDSFVQHSTTSNFAYRDPSNGSWPGCTFATDPVQSPFQPLLTSSPTSQEHLPSRSPSRSSPTNVSPYANTGNYCPSSYTDSIALPNSFSSPHPQTSSYGHAVKIPSESNYPSASFISTQYHHPPARQDQTGLDNSYSTAFDGGYHSSGGPEPTHSEHSNTPQAQSLYNSQPSSYATYDNGRGSVVGSEHPYSYSVHETHDNIYNQGAEQSASSFAISPPYSASPTAHTPNSSQAPPIQEPASPQRHGIGSTNAVRRRVGIMLHAQQCQQVEQTERSRARMGSSKGCRDKLTPTSDGSREGQDASAKYKAAYERIRLQRDFYERAASSLVHQVDILGGDPMQASRQASKEGELDSKAARILISSLQRELENLRAKLIETQKEIYSLRQSCDDSSRSVSSGYFIEEGDDNSPLSAAPVTVCTHRRK